MPDTVYFMGIRLQKRTVQTLLLNTRIQKYLDDLISGLHTYMRTGTEPRLNYSAIATRLVRLIEQEQLLYMTSDGRTYLSETECAAILSPKLADNVRLLLVICNDELSTAVRQEALQTLTSGANLDSDKILKTVTQVQGLLHLPTRLFWGGIAVCIVSFCLLLFFNRRRKGRALLFAAIPLFLCGLAPAGRFGSAALLLPARRNGGSSGGRRAPRSLQRCNRACRYHVGMRMPSRLSICDG